MIRRFLLAAALTTFVGFAGVAHAEIFAAGPVYGGFLAELTGAVVTVRVFNAGLSPVTISNTNIYFNTNTTATLISNTCLTNVTNPPLGPNQYCAFAATIPGNLAVSCRLVASGIETNIRGACEVRGTSGHILSAEPLAK